MCWSPRRSTTARTPIPLSGPGPTRRCGNGSPSMRPEFVSELLSRNTRTLNAGGEHAIGVFCCCCGTFSRFLCHEMEGAGSHAFHSQPTSQVTHRADLDGLPSNGKVVLLCWNQPLEY